MKYKASALACLIFAFAFPLFSASSVYESRLFGKVSATQGRDEVVLQCESAQKARECASKYMTDILLIGTAVPEGNAIRLKGKGSYVQCNTNGEYRLLSGVFGPSSQFDSANMARITVYGDEDQVLYTSQDIHHNEKNVYFGVDVSGQKQIRVEVSLIKDNEWDDPVILFDGLSLYK